MSEAKIKACPFCGTVANSEAILHNQETYYYSVGCRTITCRGHWMGCPGDRDEQKVIEQWNARAGGGKPEAGQNSEAKGQFAPCPGSPAPKCKCGETMRWSSSMSLKIKGWVCPGMVYDVVRQDVMAARNNHTPPIKAMENAALCRADKPE